MQLSVPSGYFCEDYCIWGDLGSGGVISRSYDLSLPDLSSSDDQAHKHLEEDLRLMLGCLKPGEKCQVSYHTASDDFATPIDRYENKTRHSNIEICTSVRSELVDRYRARMREETLIQGNVTLSLSSKLPKFEKDNGRRIKGFADVFKIHTRSFEQRSQFFNLLLSSYGGGCLAFDNDKHYDQMIRFWSPNQSRNPRFTDIDYLRPIDDLCRFSGVAPRHDPDHGFYMDGYYFGLLVAKTLPRSTFSRTMDAFMSLAVPNIRVVLNLQPLSIETELLYEEKRFDKLWTNTIAESNSKDAPSLPAINGIEAHQLRHKLLLSNKVIPFKCQLIVIACEKTCDKLDEKMETLRAALGKTGCEAFQPSLATSTLSFFNCATPGYGPWVPYQDFNHKVNDAVNAANLIPTGSTPKADLDEADWIADGDQNNLIGGKCFTDAQSDHMMVAGMTGAGKCLGKGAPVMLASGEIIPVESVKVGDLLMGDDSTPRKVLRTNVGFGRLYKVIPTKGQPWICNDAHVMTLRYKGDRHWVKKKTINGGRVPTGETHPSTYAWNAIIDIELAKFLEKKNPEKRIDHYWNLFRVPVDFAENDRSPAWTVDDFYFFGLWLGDGSTHSVVIHNIEQEIRRWLNAYAIGKGWGYTEAKKISDLFSNGYSIRMAPIHCSKLSDEERSELMRMVASGEKNQKQAGNIFGVDDSTVCRMMAAERLELATGIAHAALGHPLKKMRRYPHPMISVLKEFGYRKTKRIPLWAMACPREKRLALLAGLLDTDGHLSRGYFEITQKSKELAESIAFIAGSLGFGCWLKPVHKRCQTGAAGTYYRQSICGHINEIPTLVARKKASVRRQIKDVTSIGWRVEPFGFGDYYGFSLDGNGRFLLGDFTVTHNSSTLQSIALQTAPIFGFMVVIDDGLSWMTTCHKLDPTCKPIIVKPNEDLTFNPFDTRHQQLSPEHKSNATALCHLLVGQHSDQDLDKLRHAILFETISEIYGVACRKWRKNNPEKYYQLCEENGIVFGDASETEAQNIACASWSPEEFPTLSDLQDELHSASLQKGPHQTLCATLATLLRPWLRDGNYGALMDGVGNIDLGSVDIKSGDPLKVIHFEFGEISKAQTELRAVAGFLIANEIRNHIKGMNRGIRKQVIVEEMVSFLRVPDAENIIVEYWQTMRKFMTQMVAVFQDYSTLLEVSPKVAQALISNSSSMLLLRNQNTKDLETLSSYMPQPIPGVIQDQIRRFPRPADLKKDERYAGFVYVKLTGDKPQYCVGRNYITDEVEAITSSSGSDFERKKKELNDEITNTNDDDSWSPFGRLLDAATYK